MLKQGLYIILQMDWNRAYCKVHISISAIIVTGKKISRAVRSYKGCLETSMVVNLTTESGSVRASTVDHSLKAIFVVNVLLSALYE